MINMNRFEHATPAPVKYIARYLPIVFFIVVFVVFFILLGNVSSDTLERQKNSLETAMEHNIAQCYALEGSYPPNVDYLKDHYGLTYDDKTFVVQYTYYGGNLYPDYVVTYRTGLKMTGN